MRWVFLTVIVLLFELFSYATGRGLQWWLHSWAGMWFTEKSAQKLMIGVFVFSNLLFIIGMARMTSFGLKIAMSWLTVMWFFIMSMIVVGLVGFVIHRVAPQFYSTGVAIILPLVFLGLVAISVYNAYTPVIRHIRVTTNKALDKPIRLAMVSDLHLGRLVGIREIDNLTKIIQQQKVDVLLMPGDILDDNTDYYDSLKMQPALQNLVKAVPMGVYATLGNHDMYGHELAIRDAVKNANITLLADENLLIDNQVWLVGRLDNHAQNRKPTAELMPKSLDKPIILLDHEPTDIEKNVELPIDLQVSGHTHNGQIFPANFIVKALNRLAYGHERIHDTDVVVSSGYGFWGVPFRLGSQSEVWIIDLVGKN